MLAEGPRESLRALVFIKYKNPRLSIMSKVRQTNTIQDRLLAHLQ